MKIEVPEIRGRTKSERRGASTILLPLAYLVPLAPLIDQATGVIVWVVEAVVEGVLALIGTIFVGITRVILQFPPPSQISSLSNYYDSMIGLFLILLLLGGAIFLVYMQIFPESPKADPYRLIERGFAGFVLVLVGKPLFDNAVWLTNQIIGVLMPGSYSLDVISGGLGALLGAGGVAGAASLGLSTIASFLFAIFGGWSTLITIFLFWVVLAMRMLIVYVVFGLFPLLIVFWIFDMGVLKYASQASEFAFKVAGFLLIIGVVVAGILGVGDAIAGEGATESGVFANISEGAQNATDGGGGNGSAASLAGPGSGSVDVGSEGSRGGAFQSGGGSGSGSSGNNSTGANMSEVNASAQRVAENSGSMANILIRIFAYIGSLWLSIAIVMSGLGVVISTGGGSRRATGAGTSAPDQSSQGSSSGVFGGSGGSGGSVTGTSGGSTVMQGGDSNQKGVAHSDGATETSGSSSVTSNGGVSGDQLDDVSTDEMGNVEPMSMRDKGKAAFGGAAGTAASTASSVGSKATDASSTLDSAAEFGKEKAQGAADSVQGAADSARDVGESVADTRPGKAGVWAASGAATMGKAAGRAAKGAATTYGKMFAEEDPVRSARIGLNAMRRSPIGDPRRSNTTGDLKNSSTQGDLDDSDGSGGGSGGVGVGDGVGGDSDEGSSPGRAAGPYQSEAAYQQEGYESGGDGGSSPNPAAGPFQSEAAYQRGNYADGDDDSGPDPAAGPFQSEAAYQREGYESDGDGGSESNPAAGPYQSAAAYQQGNYGTRGGATASGSGDGAGTSASGTKAAIGDSGSAMSDAETGSSDDGTGGGGGGTTQQAPTPDQRTQMQDENVDAEYVDTATSEESPASGTESPNSSGTGGSAVSSTGDPSGDETWESRSNENWVSNGDYGGEINQGTEVQYSGERETESGEVEEYQSQGTVVGERSNGSFEVDDRKQDRSSNVAVPPESIDSVRDDTGSDSDEQ